jgi:NAD(P)-dependent dehydrogenase (short-subunit alcohol dehydrogenase family)
MVGKVCMVTGANSGIGKATAEGLARLGASVVMVCRDRGRGESAKREIEASIRGCSVELMLCDLASLESVRSFAKEFARTHSSLHVLLNNAGVVSLRRSTTVDGFEATFQVNYLSHFLLTNLLLDLLQRSAPSRIVNVSSGAHFGGSIDLDDLRMTRGYGVMKAYSRSKLAQVLFTYELARRLAGTGVTVNCLHPGAIATALFGRPMGSASFVAKGFRLFMPGPEQGAKTSIYLASSPEVEGVTGKYFDRMREKRSSVASYDEGLARRLWAANESMTGLLSRTGEEGTQGDNERVVPL